MHNTTMRFARLFFRQKESKSRGKDVEFSDPSEPVEAHSSASVADAIDVGRDAPSDPPAEEFDEERYLLANPDVAEAVAAGHRISGWEHYCTLGHKENRPMRPRREEILKYVAKSAKGIEVGPYFTPLAPKREGYNCLSLDVFPTDELRRRAEADPHIPDDKISDIEDVDLIGTATEIGTVVARSFGAGSVDYIISSHNFEHLPDPIHFLQGCCEALKPGGYLSMAIPDLRCCFDYFRWPTTLTEWLNAYFEHRTRPTAAEVFTLNAYQSRAFRDGEALIGFDLVTPRDTIKPLPTLRDAFQRWVSFNAEPDDAYHDTHCSALTPASFEQLMLELRLLGLVSLQCVEIKGPFGNEFFTHLQNLPATTNADTDAVYAQREQLMRRVIAEMALKA